VSSTGFCLTTDRSLGPPLQPRAADHGRQGRWQCHARGQLGGAARRAYRHGRSRGQAELAGVGQAANQHQLGWAECPELAELLQTSPAASAHPLHVPHRQAMGPEWRPSSYMAISHSFVVTGPTIFARFGPVEASAEAEAVNCRNRPCPTVAVATCPKTVALEWTTSIATMPHRTSWILVRHTNLPIN